MNQLLMNFAASSPGEGGILGALGIDWMVLGLQTLAFLVLLWALGKFVYPPLLKMLDKRDEAARASERAVLEARTQAENTEQEVARLLKAARREAADIVDTARDEAAATVETAAEKARVRSEHIVAEARAQVDKDIEAARGALRAETLELVALATEKVVGEVAKGKIDEKIIKSAIERAR